VPRARPANGAHDVDALRTVLSRVARQVPSLCVCQQTIAMLVCERFCNEGVHVGLLFSNIGVLEHKYVRALRIGSLVDAGRSRRSARLRSA
jgi:hypothetical protein